MKLSRFIFVVTAFSLTLASCENWLSVSPRSEVKYADMFSTKNGFKDQLTGIYTAMCSENLYGANLTYGMVDAMGQQYVWNRTNGIYYHLARFEYEDPKSEDVVSRVWNSLYNAIANVNILLKGIREYGGVLSPAERDIFEGEALALRAMLHFDALRLFGKSHAAGAQEKAIPYVKVISKEVTPLSTVSDALELIVDDLEKAAALLENDPLKTGETATPIMGTRVVRLNYYAVRALLARVYLYADDKPHALENALDVIGSGRFPWVESAKVTTSTRDDRDGLFLPECIFMLNNTQLNDLTSKYLREEQAEVTDNILSVGSQVRNEIFEADRFGGFDWRYIYYFQQQKEDSWGSTKLWQYRYFMPEAYRNRQPLVRLSEMYLIAAECAPSKTDAVGFFNELRRHRGFNPGDDLPATIGDEALQNEIGKEYRKEFIGEGQWFFYCKRTDRDDLPNATVPFGKALYVVPMPDLEKEYGNRN